MWKMVPIFEGLHSINRRRIRNETTSLQCGERVCAMGLWRVTECIVEEVTQELSHEG